MRIIIQPPRQAAPATPTKEGMYEENEQIQILALQPRIAR